MKTRRTFTFLLVTIAALLAAGIWSGSPSTLSDAVRRGISGKRYTLNERITMFGPSVRSALMPYFSRAGVPYPPKKLILVGLKSEARLEVYAGAGNTAPVVIRDYPILRASGGIGPKLREGDLQVPEGMYRIESLNPNSRFHLSLRIGYPNSLDRRYAANEGRTNLGGDIMIHGSRVSIGCLAMGDRAAEELFILAADTGLENIEVILSPVDFRVTDIAREQLSQLPEWTPDLYRSIRERLARLPRQVRL